MGQAPVSETTNSDHLKKAGVLFPIAAVLALLLVTGISCSKKYSLQKLPATYLVFGSSGGFSGEFKEYTLLQNGQLFKVSRIGARNDTVSLNRVSKKIASSRIAAMQRLDLGPKNIRETGNMTYFLRFIKDTSEVKCIFNDEVCKKNKGLDSLYKSLLELVRTDTKK